MVLKPIHTGQCHCCAVKFGINVRCLEGINPYELGEIPVSNGVNHPAVYALVIGIIVNYFRLITMT